MWVCMCMCVVCESVRVWGRVCVRGGCGGWGGCVHAHVTTTYMFCLVLSLQPSGSAVCVYSASRSSGSVVNNGLYDIFTRQFVGGVDNNVVSVSALCPCVPCQGVWNHCTVRPHLSTRIRSG